MLEQFTWLEFLACALPLTLAWYAWLLLIYNGGGDVRQAGRDARGLFSPVQADSMRNVPAERGDEGVMGKSKMPEGSTRMLASDVVFAGDLAEDFSDGVIPDVMEELRMLFMALAQQDGSKTDFFRLMEGLKLRYPGLRSHPQLASLNAFLSEHAPFLLEAGELETLWD